MPSQEIGLDVLGLAIDDEDGSFSSAKGRTSAFEADDMFEVDDIEEKVREALRRTVRRRLQQSNGETPEDDGDDNLGFDDADHFWNVSGR